MTEPVRRWSVLDLVEGFHLAHAVAVLHDSGILAALPVPDTAAIASQHGFDPTMLTAVLDYVAERTDLVERTENGYVATDKYSVEACAIVDQYLGAYGPNSADIARLLREPGQAGTMIDRARQARAYERLPGPGIPGLAQILRQLELGHVLDVGCGPAALLVDLAQNDQAFVGWGVDASPAMCAAARRRIVAAGVAERVGLFEGDARALDNVLPLAIRDQIRTVTAVSLINEFFAPDSEPAIAWLRALGQLLPGRILVIADYYGRLGRSRQPGSRYLRLHDYVQAISGQGVPPADITAWQEIYQGAGCALAHVIEDPESTCFIHLLKL